MMTTSEMTSSINMLSANKTSPRKIPPFEEFNGLNAGHLTRAISPIHPRNEIPHSGEKPHLNLHFPARCFLLHRTDGLNPD